MGVGVGGGWAGLLGRVWLGYRYFFVKLGDVFVSLLKLVGKIKVFLVIGISGVSFGIRGFFFRIVWVSFYSF